MTLKLWAKVAQNMSLHSDPKMASAFLVRWASRSRPSSQSLWKALLGLLCFAVGSSASAHVKKTLASRFGYRVGPKLSPMLAYLSINNCRKHKSSQWNGRMTLSRWAKMAQNMRLDWDRSQAPVSSAAAFGTKQSASLKRHCPNQAALLCSQMFQLLLRC